MLRIRSPRDFWAGALFMAVGGSALWLNQAHEIGRAAEMGPGYFPLLLAMGLILFGGIAFVRGIGVKGEAITQSHLRPLVVVVMAIVAFGLLIRPFGLAPTVLAVSVIVALASRDRVRWGETALLSTILAGFTVFLFVTLLGQPLAVWGSH